MTGAGETGAEYGVQMFSLRQSSFPAGTFAGGLTSSRLDGGVIALSETDQGAAG